MRATRVIEDYLVVQEINPKTGISYKTVSKERINKNVQSLNFPLREVTEKELDSYKANEKPALVVKLYGKYFYTTIPKDMSLMGIRLLGNHKCAAFGKECKRLSAASDENGGCEKVRRFSCGIENYPFIISGYETFNTEQNIFVVQKCENFE